MSHCGHACGLLVLFFLRFARCFLQSEALVQAHFRVAMGHRAAIQNTGDSATALKRGAILVAFGKTTWTQLGPEADYDQQHELLYELKSDQDLVLHNGVVSTLREVVTERRKTHPKCKLAYHTMKDAPGTGDAASPGVCVCVCVCVCVRADAYCRQVVTRNGKCDC